MNINNFKKVELKDKFILDKYISESETMFSHYNFTNLFCWQHYYKTYWQIDKDKLYIYHDSCKALQIPPKEDISAEELHQVSFAMKRGGLGDLIGICSDNFVKNNKDELGNYFETEPCPADSDYIYTIEKLVNLKGRKLHKKRNLIKQFMTNHQDYKCVQLSSKNREQCYELANEWQLKKNGKSLKDSPEYNALQTIFKYCHELDIEAYGIYIDNKLEAFSISSRQNSKTVSVHFEKYNSDIKGLSQIINRDSAKNLIEYEYVNREQDLGMENLRKAKESYLPDILLKAYTLIPKQKI